MDFEVIQKIQISFDFFCRLRRFAGCFTTVQIGEFLNEIHESELGEKANLDFK